MTITPLRSGTDDQRAAELLIQEARQLGRRRHITMGVVTSGMLLTVAAVILGIAFSSPSTRTTGANGDVTASDYPRCTTSQVSVVSEGQVGAGGTDGGVLLFRNVSSRACSLSGYPNVEGIAKSGSSITASHVPNDMLGGLNWNGTNAPKLPVVVLANRGQFASDWYQYSENGPVGYHLFQARILRVELPGSKSAVLVKGSVDAAEGRMVVTPFVPGKSGTSYLKLHN